MSTLNSPKQVYKYIRNFKQEGDETLYQAWERIRLDSEGAILWHDIASSIIIQAISGSMATWDTTHALIIDRHFGEKWPSLEELRNKHLEESTRRRAEMEEWVKKLQENDEIILETRVL
ncbi:hypothetical protein Tco_0946140 [Tanacetum coccineum]